MAERRPLVVVSGQVRELPAGDSLPGSGGAGLVRSARTSNTALTADDIGKLIDITSGTFTQTIDDLTTLGNGWFVYYRNFGTGVITIDPFGSQTIDGALIKTLDQNQSLIVICDGSSFYTVPVSGVGNNYVAVNTGNGCGSSNTRIRRFATTQGSSGTAITYSDSGTLGGSFTINESGLYAISYTDARTTAGFGRLGISVNSSSLSTDIQSISALQRICSGSFYTDSGSAEGSVSAVVRLSAGDVIRAHVGANLPDATSSVVALTIRKVGL